MSFNKNTPPKKQQHTCIVKCYFKLEVLIVHDTVHSSHRRAEIITYSNSCTVLCCCTKVDPEQGWLVGCLLPSGLLSWPHLFHLLSCDRDLKKGSVQDTDCKRRFIKLLPIITGHLGYNVEYSLSIMPTSSSHLQNIDVIIYRTETKNRDMVLKFYRSFPLKYFPHPDIVLLWNAYLSRSVIKYTFSPTKLI